MSGDRQGRLPGRGLTGPGCIEKLHRKVGFPSRPEKRCGLEGACADLYLGYEGPVGLAGRGHREVHRCPPEDWLCPSLGSHCLFNIGVPQASLVPECGDRARDERTYVLLQTWTWRPQIGDRAIQISHRSEAGKVSF